MKSQIRGEEDLIKLWSGLGVAVRIYNIEELQYGASLSQIIDKLRALAWRDYCAELPVTGRCCVNTSEKRCQYIDQSICKADILFPGGVGGGVNSWRMATLFLHALPHKNLLRLLVFGPNAEEFIDWADICLQDVFGFGDSVLLDVKSVVELMLPADNQWTVHFVTPWIIDKMFENNKSLPRKELVRQQLSQAVTARAHKISALCLKDEYSQKLSSHLVHHVSGAVLTLLKVDAVNIEKERLLLNSTGNRRSYEVVVMHGTAKISSSHNLSPWLTLIDMCGGGKNPDKGFGGVEIIADNF